MLKLGHYLPFGGEIQKFNFLGEKPQRSKNTPKLGHYLPFEQKIQKYNFFLEKPNNLYFRGPNPKS